MNARDLRGTTGYPILKLSKMMQPTTKDRHTPGSESESTQGVDKQFARVVVFVVNGNCIELRVCPHPDYCGATRLNMM